MVTTQRHSSFLNIALALAIGLALACAPLFVSTVYAKKPKIKPPKRISYEHDYAEQQLVVRWNKNKGAKKTVVKLRKGKTVLATKKVRKKKAKFSESLLVHGQKYNIRYRHVKTKKKRVSNWRKKKFTFQDLDFDNDFISNDDDPDDDNDGILDDDDEYPVDHDNDGTPDYEDDDDDNDLVDDADDKYPNDHDNDGINDIDDADDDNDGINDVDEEAGQQYDHDNDGIEDQDDEDYEGNAPETYTITINSDGLDDNDVTIAVDDYVKWINKDQLRDRTISATDRLWSCEPMLYNKSCTKQFTEVGTYTYHDPITESSSFEGVIRVVE